uniref:IBR domain-containing protein n=1 Tax=Mycena chlorophos TaxID=658473 RepID=A0ABQ0L956_MYCCL|nr:predicted protein [Mycena chlorophos]
MVLSDEARRHGAPQTPSRRHGPAFSKAFVSSMGERTRQRATRLAYLSKRRDANNIPASPTRSLASKSEPVSSSSSSANPSALAPTNTRVLRSAKSNPGADPGPGFIRPSRSVLKERMETPDYFYNKRDILRREVALGGPFHCIWCWTADETLYRCATHFCRPRMYACRECHLLDHESSPGCGYVERWNGTVWEKMLVSSIGYVFQMGHLDGSACPNPSDIQISCGSDAQDRGFDLHYRDCLCTMTPIALN